MKTRTTLIVAVSTVFLFAISMFAFKTEHKVISLNDPTKSYTVAQDNKTHDERWVKKGDASFFYYGSGSVPIGKFEIKREGGYKGFFSLRGNEYTFTFPKSPEEMVDKEILEGKILLSFELADETPIQTATLSKERDISDGNTVLHLQSGTEVSFERVSLTWIYKEGRGTYFLPSQFVYVITRKWEQTQKVITAQAKDLEEPTMLIKH